MGQNNRFAFASFTKSKAGIAGLKKMICGNHMRVHFRKIVCEYSTIF